MKRATLLTRAQLPHQAEWAVAFAAGLQRHGWQTEITNRYEPADLLVAWGVRHTDPFDRQRQRGGEICVLERGYIGDRMEYSSVSFGGQLNGRATFRGPFREPSRFERDFGHLMKAWRPTFEGYALLIGQVEGDASVRGLDLHAFYVDAMAKLEGAGFKVKFRPHPVAAARVGKQVAPLEADLAGARLVVTLNSNTAVESVLAGVPTIAMDQGSMAWPVTGHDLPTRPGRPDREPWAHRLAWCQWRKDEMADGTCWAAIQEHAPA